MQSATNHPPTLPPALPPGPPPAIRPAPPPAPTLSGLEIAWEWTFRFVTFKWFSVVWAFLILAYGFGGAETVLQELVIVSLACFHLMFARIMQAEQQHRQRIEQAGQ